MPQMYPSGSPLQLSASGDPGDTSEVVFQTIAAAPGASTAMYINFVIFGESPNDAVTAPGQPSVSVQWDGPSQTYTPLVPGQFQDVPAANGGSVSVGYLPTSADGVYQLQFNPDLTSYDLSGQTWKIQFSNADSSPAQVTFVVDSANTTLPWLALPPAFDFGQAFGGVLTLSGASGAAKQLVSGQTYTPLAIPVGNYGTAPLSVSAVAPTAATNGFTVTGTPLTIAPGSTGTLSATFSPTSGAQSGSASNPTVFTLTTTDPNTSDPTKISMYASVGSYEFVFALDMSGSMGYDGAGNTPNPPSEPSRWSWLQEAATTVMDLLGSFASTDGYYGIVVYPGATAGANSQVVAGKSLPTPASPNPAISTGASIPWTGLTPTNGTPMAGVGTSPGVTANLGGIYKAMGDPGNSPSADCGLFFSSGASSVGFANNHRWLILMSDGASNIGDDPATIPASYYSDRKVQAITVAFGVPGAGQVDVATLQAVAVNSTGIQLSDANTTYLAANPSGNASDNLSMKFMKATTRGLGLTFGSDPDAVLQPGGTNQHRVIVTEYDTKAAFFVCGNSFAVGSAFEVTLITPDGQQVNPKNASTFGLTYTATQLSRTYFGGLAALAPAGGTPRYGTWTIVVSATIQKVDANVAAPAAPSAVFNPGPQGLEYAYSLIVDSGLNLSLSSGSGGHYAGDAIVLDAYLAAHGTPIPNAQVTVQVTGTGVSFDNWLAAQTVTAAEYAAALTALGTMHDYQSQYVKARALQAKGITYPGTTSSAAQPLAFNGKTGAYKASFGATDQPATFQFLVTATGQDSLGNLYQRQQTETIAILVQPTVASTVVFITYQVVGAQMQATMRFWPKDDYGNVFLVDPTISSAIKVLLQGGATASGPLKDNYDGSYTQLFTYPVSSTPIVSIDIYGNGVLNKLVPPDFGTMIFVDEVVSYTKGREAKAGLNAHTNASEALGDPSKKPLTSFVSLGGLGSATFDVKGKTIKAKEVTVFVAPDTSLRSYAVDVLPVQSGVGWVEVGRSVGVTQTFSLVPGSGGCQPSPKGSYIELKGEILGDTFDVTVPLAGQLHAPVDPLKKIGTKGIGQVRIRDLSNVILNPDRSGSTSPGVSIAGVGFTP